jgi:hypothetical protein
MNAGFDQPLYVPRSTIKGFTGPEAIRARVANVIVPAPGVDEGDVERKEALRLPLSA